MPCNAKSQRKFHSSRSFQLSTTKHPSDTPLSLRRDMQTSKPRLGKSLSSLDTLKHPVAESVTTSQPAYQDRESHQSTPTTRTPFLPPLSISCCNFRAASPPPAPAPAAPGFPTMTCDTVLRAIAIEMRAPCKTSRCLTLWSEIWGSVEPFT